MPDPTAEHGTPPVLTRDARAIPDDDVTSFGLAADSTSLERTPRCTPDRATPSEGSDCRTCAGSRQVVVVHCLRCLRAMWTGLPPVACEACETADCPTCHPAAGGGLENALDLTEADVEEFLARFGVRS